MILCDGAPVHFNLKMLERARELNIHINTLPSNTTHITQLQDKFIFANLKLQFKKKATEWHEKYHEQINNTMFIQLMNKIWKKVNDPAKIKIGFQKLGYFPLNRELMVKTVIYHEPAIIFEEIKEENKQTTANEPSNNLNGNNSPSLASSVLDYNNLKDLSIEAREHIRTLSNTFKLVNEALENKENLDPSQIGVLQSISSTATASSNKFNKFLNIEILSPEKNKVNVPRTVQQALTVPLLKANGKIKRGGIRKLNQRDSLALTSDSVYETLKENQFEALAEHCKRISINKRLSLIAETVFNHRLKALQHSCTDQLNLKHLLGHVFLDSNEYESPEYKTFELKTVYEMIKQTTLTHQPQIIREAQGFKSITAKRLNKLLTALMPKEAPYSILGGWMLHGLSDQVISSQIDMVYDCKHIDESLTASNLFLFNQDPAISAGHFDGECGYLYLKRGIKIWLTVPFDNEKFDEKQWKVLDLIKEKNRRWFVQQPGDLVVLSGSIKHMVISIVPCVAVGGYFNNALGTLDSLALYTKIRAQSNRLDPNKFLVDLGIDSASINHLLSTFTLTCRNLPKLKKKNLKTLFLARKNDFEKYKNSNNNSSIVDRINELYKLFD